MPVHAYDQPDTILGQGTVGLELEEQAPTLTTTLAAGKPVDAKAVGVVLCGGNSVLSSFPPSLTS